MSIRVIRTRALPDQARHGFEIEATVTVAEIIDRALPNAPETVLDRLRVTLVAGDGQTAMIPRLWWGRVRPHSGTTVVIRVVPGELVTMAAAYLTHLAGTAYFAATGAFLSAAAVNAIYFGSMAAIVAIGGALINALTPRPELPGGGRDPEAEYKIDGWKNRAAPGDPVPLPFGHIRVAPVFAARPYTEIVGDDQYVRTLFLLGYGRLDVSDIRIGDTPIENFQNVDYEVREGAPDDEPVTLTSQQVIEEVVGVELNKSAGPWAGSTARSSVRASLVIHFPAGLIRNGETSDNTYSTSVTLRIRQRQDGGEWQLVHDLRYKAKKRDPFFRQYTWTLPHRGAWDIDVELVDGRTDRYTQNTVVLSALQSIRPEYPIATDVPLALLAVRIRASHQLSGSLDSVNALVKRHALEWDGAAWITGLPRNPASAFIHALQGAHAVFPVEDAGIDFDALAEWFDFCVAKGLHYDHNRAKWGSLRELLIEIAKAGRASPRHDGVKWSVVIDRPAAHAIDHIHPRNSQKLRGRRIYADFPDAIRVRFADEENDYQESEVVVRWPGHVGSIDVIEEWQAPGKTNAQEIMREIYRDMQVAIHRRDRWMVEQDGLARVATRGDTIRLSHDVLSDVQAAARVLEVRDRLIVLDSEVLMEAGTDYGVRYLDFDESDPVGQSVLTAVQTVEGVTRALHVTGEGVPAVGALIVFGVLGEESEEVLVLDVEPGKDGIVPMTLTNAAPEIDALTDAYVPPEWDPVVGEVIDAGGLPVAPVLVDIETEGDEGSFGTTSRAVLVAASGDPADTVAIASITLRHRLAGAGTWAEATIPGASGTATLTYDLGDEIELQLVAVNFADGAGAASDIAAYTVGDRVPLPAALDLDSIEVAGAIGHAVLSLAHSDPATTEIAVFRTPNGGTLDTATDEVRRVEATAGSTVVIVDGDSTRSQMLGAGMSSWTAGGGWTIAGGEATHTPGSESTLSQAVTLEAGQTYRGYITVSGRTAGSVTARLAGGTAVATDPITADGQTLIALEAAPGNDRIEIVATSDFDGSIEAVLLYRESAGTAPQGAQDYRFAAINAEGVGSAPSSAITVTII
ncbi:TipJ family phage tail tip protein [Citreimonas salinaria]|uniref:Phage-related protein, tail component n=1 Tax=Citreimonas salinaria TaxID=321339 RepID=A0A1H3KVB3_9RHOB|nr:phage tail protein [Citreimonas salinaria]SDY55604.1 Phage-related protein, tail component [Citreimonas salinaria]